MTSRVATETDRAAASEQHDTRPVFGYVRVSSDRQETERQHDTIPARLATLPDGLASNALELFYDHGISAWSGKARPDFEKMLERIRAQEASALIIDTSSRLTREGVRAALSIFFDLQDASCRLFTTQGREYGFDLGGLISLIVDAEADERYSATLSHNITTGKAAKASKGKHHAGDLPPGYQRNETGDLEATDDLPHIGEIFRRFAAGEPYQPLCTYATENISTDALVRRKRHSAIVAKERLRGWLKNGLYAGFIVHNGELHKGTHPTAVDLPTFEKVQSRIRELAAKRETWAPRGEWALAGIAKHQCGHNLRRHPVTRPSGKTYYYTRCADPACAKSEGVYTLAAVEANIVLALAVDALAVEQFLSDPNFGIPTGDGPTLEEALAVRDEARIEVKRLGGLIADRAMEQDDPRFEQALCERDDAEATVERTTSSATSYRDELAALAASVLSLAAETGDDAGTVILGGDLTDEVSPYEEETVTIIGRQGEQTHVQQHGAEPSTSLVQILRGWQGASTEKRRDVLRSSLTAAVVGPDSIELHFRTGLPQPLVTSNALPVQGRGEDIRELEAAGYGTAVVRHASPQ